MVINVLKVWATSGQTCLHSSWKVPPNFLPDFWIYRCYVGCDIVLQMCKCRGSVSVHSTLRCPPQPEVKRVQDCEGPTHGPFQEQADVSLEQLVKVVQSSVGSVWRGTVLHEPHAVDLILCEFVDKQPDGVTVPVLWALIVTVFFKPEGANESVFGIKCNERGYLFPLGLTLGNFLWFFPPPRIYCYDC